jgi:putative Ca2+/H+ antiporter (TMEM165/GDT1 family)
LQEEVKDVDLETLLKTFGMIFLAERGDKTQLAFFAFAAGTKSRLSVFIGSASALVFTSFLAVIFGSTASKLIPANYVRMGAAVLFIVLGFCMFLSPEGK